jgi:alginate O-acetyltransferase complex protein AlgJ
MNRLSFSHPMVRAAFCALLLALPLTSAWNLAIAPSHPGLAIQIGPKLGGVTRDAPVTLTWSSLRDHSFQKAVSARVTDAMAIRPLLIRINNEIRFSVFGELTAPQVIRGANGHLIERSYLDEYCARTEDQPAAFAADIIPKLLDIQNYYRSHGGIFVYLVTPSKAAHLPEYFVDRVPCPSTPAARTQFVPRYVNLLRQAGIDVVDTASLIHALKGHYEVELFPQGGVHWNDIGGAQAVTAVVDDINRQAGRQLVPPFTFTYTLSGVTSGVDRDLADLLNVLFPPLAYLTPKVTFQQPASCADHPARLIDAAIVGSSFSHLPGQILVEDNCLFGLNVYYYMRLGRFGGPPYHELQRNLTDADLVRLRDAKIMIVEENESFVARTGYVNELRKIVTTPQ